MSDNATILALEIVEILTGWYDWAEATRRGQTGQWEPRRLYRGSPTEIWGQWLAQWTAPEVPEGSPFQGGALGLLSYELNRSFERIPNLTPEDIELPLFVYYLPRVVLRYDHHTREVEATRWLYLEPGFKRDLRQVWEEETSALRMLKRAWDHAAIQEPEPFGATDFNGLPDAVPGPMSLDQAAYEAAVETAQDYIARGHTYQVNLALRQSQPTEQPGWRIYEAIRRINPSPYMGFWRHPDFEIISGSPELLTRKRGNRVSARPIAGTRPRGTSAETDAELSRELADHPKENAEHLMLVDLIRNDLGRISQYGSVHVPEFQVQEFYSHVIHLVSQVEGIWNDALKWWDLIPAVFPGGTITGAPKVRTMEIIEELEPVHRHFYTGSMGWVSFAGDSEWNILIRTFLLQEKILHLHTGAGIVADSNPGREFLECLQKGKGLWKALALAES